jgi:hypothetical protein
MKNRLINRARNVAKPYEEITEEGLLLKGTINFKDLKDVSEVLEVLKENDVEFELLNDRLLLNPEILEDLIDHLKENNFDFKFSAYISEYYPTSDKLEVERIPLVTKKPNLKLKKK